MRAGFDVPLVGREIELAAIDAVLTRAANGSREALVFEGEAGIGKTRLVSEAATRARNLGFTVFRGVADDIEQARSYGVLLNAFEPAGAGSFEGLNNAEPERADPTPIVVDALVSIVEDASRSAPVALLVDDLHWADAGTLRALRALVRRAASFPFAFVAATRPSPTIEQLDALIDTVRAEGSHIELDPLDDDAVSSLVDKLVAGSLTAELHTRVTSARGNPFFVIEIIASGVDEIGTSGVPRDLRRTVLRRVMQLSQETRSALRLASLLGPMIDPDELALIARRTASDITDVIEQSVRARILEERDGSLVFRHDIVRQAIYTDIPASVRQRLHRETGAALAQAGASASRVAAHFAAAARPGDAEAVSWLRRAAAESIQRSPSHAADLLAQALGLIEATDPARDEVRAERVQALALAGRVSEASALAAEVLATLRDAALAADVRASLGEALTLQGRLIEAAEQYGLAAADATEASRGLLLAEAAITKLLSNQLPEADELALRALGETASTHDPRARSLATSVRAGVMTLRGDFAALDVAREAVRIADEDFLDESHRYGARAVLGLVLTDHARFDEAVAVLREGIELDEKRGVSWLMPAHYAVLGFQYFARGEWDDAIAELETVESLLDEMGSDLFGPLACGLLAMIAVHRGDLARAEDELRRGEAHMARTGSHVGAQWLAEGRMALLEARGDLDGARAMVRVACDVVVERDFPLGLGRFAPMYVHLAKLCGSPQEARFAVEALETVLTSERQPFITLSALLCRVMLDEERPERLLEVLEDVEYGTHSTLLLGTTYEEAGLAMARAGDRASAVEQLNRAIAVYEALAAQLDVDRVTDALRGAGGRRRSAKRRPVSGWESLSPTERKVVAFVAEGLTNPAIAEKLVVSRRTVETHISHLFRKLGVTSRVELVLRATRELAAKVP